MVTNTPAPPASRLHHHAYVVDDMEATRHFYEDVLGFPLVATWCEIETVRGKEREYIHTFFELADGSALAFFQFADPADQAEMRLDSRDSLNHVALNTDAATQQVVRERLDTAGVGHRSVNHGYCVSLYILDPDGLTVEFTVDADGLDEVNERQRRTAHDELARWLAGDHTPNNNVRADRRPS
ncbi:MAG: VOC family protein [Actinomycetota bacterium]|nr:VOC family protein [Actinomycetota bacterium]